MSSTISIPVDVTNPGQFFACCGLLELAHRLWPGAEGWFEGDVFRVRRAGGASGGDDLNGLVSGWRVEAIASGVDAKVSPLALVRASQPGDGPAARLVLDWWLDDSGVGGSLKTWAGQQRVENIARATLHSALEDPAALGADWFDLSRPARLPGRRGRIVEPFYFDARRFAHALDVGFSLDTQGLDADAHPAVEFLALIGLQRFVPAPTAERNTFEYWAWRDPMPAPVAAAAACGAVRFAKCTGYRFDLQFRDDQRRYKAFGFASVIGGIP